MQNTLLQRQHRWRSSRRYKDDSCGSHSRFVDVIRRCTIVLPAVEYKCLTDKNKNKEEDDVARENGRGRGGGTRGDKLHVRRSYRLLLLALCLLAWPSLCSTSPSGHLVSTFAQNPTLSNAKSPVQREKSKPSDASSSRQPDVQSSDHDDCSQQPEAQGSQQEKNRRAEELQQEEEKKPGHIYKEYLWEMNQINPWLSACDLTRKNSEESHGSCGPVDISKHCPKPCAAKTSDYFFEVIKSAGFNNTRMTTQTNADNGNGMKKSVQMNRCSFYLDKSHKQLGSPTDICQNDFGKNSAHSFSTTRQNRFWFIKGLRLRHCCEHVVVNALATGKGGPLEDVLNGDLKCRTALKNLLFIDDMASRLYCEFEEIMRRFDCRQTYSVVHTCNDCREAYRKWMCSSLVPHFVYKETNEQATTPKDNWTASRLRPCRSVCYAVEQRCPYLLPTDRAPGLSTQYAGEPTFLCGDPEIPETGEQARKSIIASPGECCYYSCVEDDPKAGLCDNCTEAWKHDRINDFPTAPHCDPPKSASTDAPVLQTVDSTTASTSSTLAPPTTTVDQDTLFCGNGRIGRVNTSMSFSNSPTILYIYMVLLLTLLI
ncbi:uncharacterized protein [Linepithema humile]|uniref:uncharacterized protein n=1 Tax=Linepithema humile TaxID=83485 RepID=UPI00351F8040